MAKIKYIIRSGWCRILMVLLTVLGFGACHRTQKAVVDDDNNIQQIDSATVSKPPKIRDRGEMIALYGVPPSKFKNMKQQNNKPLNK